MAFGSPTDGLLDSLVNTRCTTQTPLHLPGIGIGVSVGVVIPIIIIYSGSGGGSSGSGGSLGRFCRSLGSMSRGSPNRSRIRSRPSTGHGFLSSSPNGNWDLMGRRAASEPPSSDRASDDENEGKETGTPDPARERAIGAGMFGEPLADGKAC